MVTELLLLLILRVGFGIVNYFEVVLNVEIDENEDGISSERV